MDVDMERLAGEGEITEMFIRGLISTGLRVGMAIGEQTSAADVEAIVNSLGTAVLAGMAVPSSSALAMPQRLPISFCPTFHQVKSNLDARGTAFTVTPYACMLPARHTTSHRDELGNWWPNAATRCGRLTVTDSCRTEHHGHTCFLNTAVHEVDGPKAHHECSCGYYWAKEAVAP